MCLCLRSLENDSPWDRWTSPSVVTVPIEEEEQEEGRYCDMVNMYKLYTKATTTGILHTSSETDAVGYIQTYTLKQSKKRFSTVLEIISIRTSCQETHGGHSTWPFVYTWRADLLWGLLLSCRK